MYCMNCGEIWHDCICIPWCWDHDSVEPCQTCQFLRKEKLEKEAMLAPFLVPWYKHIIKYLTGK
jgi:hypothetical protein